ncbi:MAG: helix-turn-helix transcriptional regulator [Halobacteria archaeon]
MSELTAEEKRVLENIETGKVDYQSEVWKQIEGISGSSQASKYVESLVEEGYLTKEEATHPDGYKTYALELSDGSGGGSQHEGDTDGEHDGEGGDEEDMVEEIEGEVEEIPPNELEGRQLRAYDLIQDEVNYQSELWKNMDVSSRTGTRIAKALEKKGLIEREEVKHPDGYNTYELETTADAVDHSLLIAGDILSPFVGIEPGQADPFDSAFDTWIFSLK